MVLLVNNDQYYDFKKDIPANELGRILQDILTLHDTGEGRNIAHHLLKHKDFSAISSDKYIDGEHVVYEVKSGKVIMVDPKIDPTETSTVMDIEKFIRISNELWR